MNDRQRRIARARLLRREGKTYDGIRAVIGPVDDSTLRLWCKGIPRPKATRRSHPKLDARSQARRLRAAGFTYDAIAQELKVSKSSLSLWLRGQPGPGGRPYNHADHLKKIQPLGAKGRREQAAAGRAGQRTVAAGQLRELSPTALLIAGTVLYWAEGAKDKPWRRNGCVVFINSDPEVLSTFLAWLDLVGIPESDRRYHLQIHENFDVAEHEQWWADRLRIPASLFTKATLKRHNPKTIRRNTGDGYHGCLIVRVLRSGWLYYSIEGWWSAIVSGADSLVADGKMEVHTVPRRVTGNPAAFGAVSFPGSSPGGGAEAPGSSQPG